MIFLWRAISDTLGVVIHAEQSSVGKTLLSKIIFPPMERSFSTNNTLYPEFARLSAASPPAIPAPTMRASNFIVLFSLLITLVRVMFLSSIH